MVGGRDIRQKGVQYVAKKRMEEIELVDEIEVGVVTRRAVTPDIHACVNRGELSSLVRISMAEQERRHRV